MDNFTKIVTGWVKQYYEPDGKGGFSCTVQDFIAGDDVYFEDDEGEVIVTPAHEYQSYNMVQPDSAKEMLAAIEAGKDKVKTIEAGIATTPHSPFAELRKDSAWLDAVYDIINRTALAIKDELESIGG